MTRGGYEELSRLMISAAVKENLVKAAVYIVAYETLENLLVDRLEGFYAVVDGSTEFYRAGRLRFKPGPSYEQEVKARDKNDPLAASCRWFEECGVLTPSDTEFIKAARKRRGDLVHEMPDALFWRGVQVDLEWPERICELAGRVDSWWLANIEDAPPGAESGSVSFLRYLIAVVFAGGGGPHPRPPGGAESL